MRRFLVLFDIDGTLLKPSGIGRKSLEQAFLERFGESQVFEGVRFHGRTDPDIFDDGLRRVGGSAADYPGLLGRYLDLLQVEMSARPCLLLPGVIPLLDRLALRPDVTLGLVTGNVRRGAEIKLARDGIFQRFPVGGFGDDSTDRARLVRIARERARALGFGSFDEQSSVHVGDTEADVLAARHGGAKSVAVATGGMAKEELAAYEPDHLYDSLECVDEFVTEVLR